ncbi:unnamed protein product [Moneuplotes crassus]|uniref:Protein kinase domain-containing protein n=1 Tax=Euplotes crassus TaxID=5936 RepID=A0AAD1U3B2_EUPCR|nr:unnamed protein product [Moneuplotes crassus]
MYIHPFTSPKVAATPLSNLAPLSSNARGSLLQPSRRISRRSGTDTRHRAWKTGSRTCHRGVEVCKSRANQRKYHPTSNFNDRSPMQMPEIGTGNVIPSTHKQACSKRILRDSFTSELESRVLTPSLKNHEIAKIRDENNQRFSNLMRAIQEPISYEGPKYRSKNHAKIDIPDSLKWEFDDKGQQALEELQQFFERDSACSDEENNKEKEEESIKFSITKMGFDKPIKQETNSKTSPIKFQLSDFQILHTLGKGTSGIVKLAKHKKKNCKVVFKIYEKYKLIESQLKKALFKEIELLKSVSHPNLIKLYDVLEDEKHIYLIMEYISGGSLQQQMRARSKKITEAEAKKIFMQLSSAIKYLHSNNIYHRDIKLDNILLDFKKNIKIIDFGFSINCKPSNKLKVFCGTPCYMAPEIISKKPYHGGPIDIWALGIILYTLLIGNFPFQGSCESELYSKIKRGVFNIPDTISFTIRKLIRKMLTLDPTKRPTAIELYNDDWIRGDSKHLKKMTLKMINDQYSQNPLAKILQKSTPKSLLFQTQHFRSSARSSFSQSKVPSNPASSPNPKSMGSTYKQMSSNLFN